MKDYIEMLITEYEQQKLSYKDNLEMTIKLDEFITELYCMLTQIEKNLLKIDF